jgi:uncharacterized protein
MSPEKVEQSKDVSSENVEIVRRMIDAFNRRDIDGASQAWDREAELDWSRSRGVDAGVYRGQAEIRAFWAGWLEMFDHFTLEPDEYIDCGEHVVVPNRTHMKGRDGIQVEAHSASVVTLRVGRIVKWRLYQDRAQALKAVGVEE